MRITERFYIPHDPDVILHEGQSPHENCLIRAYDVEKAPDSNDNRYTLCVYTSPEERDRDLELFQKSWARGCRSFPIVATYGATQEQGIPFVVFADVYERVQTMNEHLCGLFFDALVALHAVGLHHGRLDANCFFLAQGTNQCTLFFPDSLRAHSADSSTTDLHRFVEIVTSASSSTVRSLVSHHSNDVRAVREWVKHNCARQIMPTSGGGGGGDDEYQLSSKRSRPETTDTGDNNNNHINKRRPLRHIKPMDYISRVVYVQLQWFQATSVGNVVAALSDFFEYYIRPMVHNDIDTQRNLLEMARQMPWPRTWYCPATTQELNQFPKYRGWIIVYRLPGIARRRGYLTMDQRKRYLLHQRSDTRLRQWQQQGTPPPDYDPNQTFSVERFPLSVRPYGLTVFDQLEMPPMDSVIRKPLLRQSVDVDTFAKLSPTTRSYRSFRFSSDVPSLQHQLFDQTTENDDNDDDGHDMFSGCARYASAVWMNASRCKYNKSWRRIMDVINPEHLEYLAVSISDDMKETFAGRVLRRLTDGRLHFPKLHTCLLSMKDTLPLEDVVKGIPAPYERAHTPDQTLPALTTLSVQYQPYEDQEQRLIDMAHDRFIRAILDRIPPDTLRVFSCPRMLDRMVIPYNQTQSLQRWNVDFLELFEDDTLIEGGQRSFSPSQWIVDFRELVDETRSILCPDLRAVFTLDAAIDALVEQGYWEQVESLYVWWTHDEENTNRLLPLLSWWVPPRLQYLFVYCTDNNNNNNNNANDQETTKECLFEIDADDPVVLKNVTLRVCRDLLSTNVTVTPQRISADDAIHIRRLTVPLWLMHNLHGSIATHPAISIDTLVIDASKTPTDTAWSELLVRARFVHSLEVITPFCEAGVSMYAFLPIMDRLVHDAQSNPNVYEGLQHLRVVYWNQVGRLYQYEDRTLDREHFMNPQDYANTTLRGLTFPRLRFLDFSHAEGLNVFDASNRLPRLECLGVSDASLSFLHKYKYTGLPSFPNLSVFSIHRQYEKLTTRNEYVSFTNEQSDYGQRYRRIQRALFQGNVYGNNTFENVALDTIIHSLASSLSNVVAAFPKLRYATFGSSSHGSLALLEILIFYGRYERSFYIANDLTAVLHSTADGSFAPVIFGATE
jgi:hypothetical protein